MCIFKLYVMMDPYPLFSNGCYPLRHLFAVILNAVMLALDDSEIPINNKFAALCLLLSENGEILPDPCKAEEEGTVRSNDD